MLFAIFTALSFAAFYYYATVLAPKWRKAQKAEAKRDLPVGPHLTGDTPPRIACAMLAYGLLDLDYREENRDHLARAYKETFSLTDQVVQQNLRMISWLNVQAGGGAKTIAIARAHLVRQAFPQNRAQCLTLIDSLKREGLLQRPSQINLVEETTQMLENAGM